MSCIKKIKESRSASFIAVTLVYIISAVAGIALFSVVKGGWWLRLLIADVGATVVTFIFSILLKNASVYDPYWSVQPPVIVAAFALSAELTFYRSLILLVIFFWVVRLTANWAYTFKGLVHQDWRYTMLCEKTGAFYPIINFVGIHMVPTLVVYGCVLPAVYPFVSGFEPSGWSYFFLAISLLAAVLQGTADIQMHRFRMKGSGGFIRDGLWKYSRHPNYLGEILMWWGIALSVVSTAPESFYLATGAVANTVLFFAVSIPMADRRQSKKDGFAEYKKETRMLLPIKK